jgi:hypothetical protein
VRRAALAATVGDDASARSAKMQAVAGRSGRTLACLARGGALVRSTDASALGIGYDLCRVEEAGEARGVHSLRQMCQSTLVDALTTDSVLPTLRVASLLGARRLQSECERLVLQNSRVLEDAGVFAAERVCPSVLLGRILANALYREALRDVPPGTVDRSSSSSSTSSSSTGTDHPSYHREVLASLPLVELDLFGEPMMGPDKGDDADSASDVSDGSLADADGDHE